MRDEVRQAFIDAKNIHATHEILASYNNQREWSEARPREVLRDQIAAGAEDEVESCNV